MGGGRGVHKPPDDCMGTWVLRLPFIMRFTVNRKWPLFRRVNNNNNKCEQKRVLKNFPLQKIRKLTTKTPMQGRCLHVYKCNIDILDSFQCLSSFRGVGISDHLILKDSDFKAHGIAFGSQPFRCHSVVLRLRL